jgi:hypothetical protein
MALFGRETERDERRAESYALWLQQRNPYAIASTVLGIFSLIEMGVLIIFGVGGIVTGAIALAQLRRPEPARPRGHALAWTGILTSVVSLILAAVLYLWPYMNASAAS